MSPRPALQAAWVDAVTGRHAHLVAHLSDASTANSRHAALNTSGRFMLTALQHACLEGSLDVVEALLGCAEVDPNACCGGGWTALMLACDAGAPPAVLDALLAHPAIDVNVANDYGRSALLFAAYRGRLETVRTLLSRLDLDLYQREYRGRSVLDVVQRSGTRMEAVSALVRAERRRRRRVTWVARVLVVRAECVAAARSRRDPDAAARTGIGELCAGTGADPLAVDGALGSGAWCFTDGCIDDVLREILLYAVSSVPDDICEARARTMRRWTNDH